MLMLWLTNITVRPLLLLLIFPRHSLETARHHREYFINDQNIRVEVRCNREWPDARYMRKRSV